MPKLLEFDEDEPMRSAGQEVSTARGTWERMHAVCEARLQYYAQTMAMADLKRYAVSRQKEEKLFQSFAAKAVGYDEMKKARAR